MLYCKIDENGTPIDTPISIGVLRRKLPDVLLKESLITDEYLKPYGYVCVPYTKPPEHRFGHKTVLDIPSRNDSGIIREYRYVEYTPEDITSMMSVIRAKRDYLLDKSDWTQLLDVQDCMSEDLKEKWKEYRQKLRDIPQDYEDPALVIFPEKPE